MQSLTRRSAIRAAAGGLGLLTVLHPDPVSAQTPRLKFELYRSGAGFRWRLKSGNGQTIASGESYTTKASCQAGIDLVRRGASTATLDDQT